MGRWWPQVNFWVNCCPPPSSLLIRCLLCDPQVGYGSTENSPATFSAHPKDNLQRRAETVGYILDHTEVPERLFHIKKKTKHKYAAPPPPLVSKTKKLSFESLELMQVKDFSILSIPRNPSFFWEICLKCHQGPTITYRVKGRKTFKTMSQSLILAFSNISVLSVIFSFKWGIKLSFFRQ